MKKKFAQIILMAVFAACAFLFSGCSTVESDNVSVRPWNTPQNWEGNALGGMDYQRR